MESLLLGVSLGLAAGLAPGPLHALVLATSLQRGFRAGARIAIAPLLTDLPVVSAGVLAVGVMPDRLVRVMAAVGGLFIIYLAMEAARWRPVEGRMAVPASTDVRRGFLANILNPHPWLFWLGVGGPLLRSAWTESWTSAGGFLVAFYVLLVGSKLLLAAVAARGAKFVERSWYRWVIRGSAALLAIMGIFLIAAAVRGTI